MSFKTDLRAYLIADAPLAALVGTRIFAGFAPTSADLPYITIQRIASPGQHHLTAAAGIANETFQIDVWTKTQSSLEAIAIAVRNALDGFGPALMGATDVRGIRLDNQSDTFDRPDDGSQGGTYRDRMDFDVWFFTNVPTFP